PVLDNDPIAPRKASAQVLVNILIQQRLARSVVDKVSVPLLMQVAGNDVMVDPHAARTMFQQLTIEDKTLIEYPEHVHAIAYDLGRELVFEDTIAWIARHL
ncbi:MAG: alpha/beta hydrolase, partial [Candidatus Omnitrophica bacterium]|nr:alpha/beta hydrolase [Candidatus Omnitrophota bacterium]